MKLLSGVAEIAIGTALVLANKKNIETIGKIAADLFIAVFPGNIAQHKNQESAFGLNR